MKVHLATPYPTVSRCNRQLSSGEFTDRTDHVTCMHCLVSAGLLSIRAGRTSSAQSVQSDVYRYFDAEGRLLYVGVSLHAVARAMSHRNLAPWWPEARVMTIEHYASRQEALDAEWAAMQTENPIHNGPRQ